MTSQEMTSQYEPGQQLMAFSPYNPQPNLPPSPKRILYIEDDFQNRRLIRKILMARGYIMLEAENAILGIESAIVDQPDLILMDINLPGIDGIRATTALKANINTRHIPIVALTASAMRGDRERIMESGCDEYLPKPISIPQLLETLATVLKG